MGAIVVLAVLPRVDGKVEVPKDEFWSMGMWDASRGYLAHHVRIDKGRILNYQINAVDGQRDVQDPFGQADSYEDAIAARTWSRSKPSKHPSAGTRIARPGPRPCRVGGRPHER